MYSATRGCCRRDLPDLTWAYRTASALAGLGLRQGDQFALMATNSDRFVVTFYSAPRCGAVVVPVNPASAPPEIAYLLTDCQAAVFAFDPAAATTVTKTASRAPARYRRGRCELTVPGCMTGRAGPPLTAKGRVLSNALAGARRSSG
jgi:acyl-coenzyme A synthetase/AMP-(fatty) acid ligase